MSGYQFRRAVPRRMRTNEGPPCPIRLRVYDKAVPVSKHPELRLYAMGRRAYVLSHIAARASRAVVPDCTGYHRREALTAMSSTAW